MAEAELHSSSSDEDVQKSRQASDPNDNLAEKGEAVAEKTDGEAAQPAARNIHGIKWFLTVLAILCANFLFALDNTIVADIQPAIVRQFASLDKITWLSVAFFLASAGTNLFWGDIYGRFSAKWSFVAAFIIFAVGSAICGGAPDMDALIVGRAICGWGGAGMYIGSMSILTVMTNDKERPLYLSIVGVTWGLGTVLGPIIGGAFVQGATWRWAFYLNLCVGGVCAPVYYFFLPKLDPRPNESFKKLALQIDYLGVVLMCGLYTAIVMAIAFGGTEFQWNSGQIIALFVVSFVLLVIFGVQQGFAIFTSKEHRIFPVEFLKMPTMIVLFIQVVTAATCVFVPIYFLPLYFQFVRGDDAIEAGVRLLPFVAFQVVVTVLSGFLLGNWGYYMPWYVIAGVLTVPGSALMYTVDINTKLANIYGYQILLATGAGATVQASFPVAQAKVEPAFVPKAIGFCTLAQLGGPTLALSIANSVFLNRAQIAIKHLIPSFSHTDIASIISDPTSPLLRNLSDSTRNSVLALLVHAMSKVYIECIVAGSITLILAFYFKPNASLYK